MMKIFRLQARGENRAIFGKRISRALDIRSSSIAIAPNERSDSMELKDIRKVLIVGGGTMGRQIAFQ
ncbi:MAG: hypothetical protein KBG12_00975, partial [Syntrophobacterales bacterium]|nr:hypothetical protein [Syntrophobacterales bacterium]